MQHLTWLNPCFSFIFLVQETPELGTYAQMLKRDPMKDKSATVFVCACVCTIALAATCDMLLPQQDVSHDQRGSASQDAAEAGVFPSFIFVHLTNFYLEKPMCFVCSLLWKCVFFLLRWPHINGCNPCERAGQLMAGKEAAASVHHLQRGHAACLVLIHALAEASRMPVLFSTSHVQHVKVVAEPSDEPLPSTLEADIFLVLELAPQQIEPIF